MVRSDRRMEAAPTLCHPERIAINSMLNFSEERTRVRNRATEATTAASLAVTFLFTLFLISQPVAVLCQDPETGHFRKWLREDVLYIITPEEADVFLGLSTDPEKELFIEQFWARRDTDPHTAINEYKEEHYRRVAYSNENFTSGFPGWKTDRGMVYIKFGEPDRRESHPTGGHYVRPSWEGGGSTSTYPFERWEYRYLEGVGQDVEIEFVDPTLTGEYRLSTNPDEKDALLLTPNAGLTDAEMLGLVSQKIDRIVRKTSPMPGHNPLLFGYGRVKDQPFQKLRLVTSLEKAPVVDFSDLRTQVLTEAYFDQLPFQIHNAVFRLSDEGRVILTLYIASGDLQFKKINQVYRGELDVQTVVKDVSGRTVEVSEDSLVTNIPETDYGLAHEEPLVYQRDLTLPPGRYKLEVFVRDRIADHLGFGQSLVVVPRPESSRLSLSSVMLARRIESVAAETDADEAVSLRIWPVVGRNVPLKNGKLGFYFEIYGFQMDQSSGRPRLDLSYEILDKYGNSWPGEPRYHSADLSRERVMIMSILKTGHLQQGDHRLHIRLHDRISDQKLSHSVEFALE